MSECAKFGSVICVRYITCCKCGKISMARRKQSKWNWKDFFLFGDVLFIEILVWWKTQIERKQNKTKHSCWIIWIGKLWTQIKFQIKIKSCAILSALICLNLNAEIRFCCVHKISLNSISSKETFMWRIYDPLQFKFVCLIGSLACCAMISVIFLMAKQNCLFYKHKTIQ